MLCSKLPGFPVVRMLLLARRFLLSFSVDPLLLLLLLPLLLFAPRVPRGTRGAIQSPRLRAVPRTS